MVFELPSDMSSEISIIATTVSVFVLLAFYMVVMKIDRRVSLMEKTLYGEERDKSSISLTEQVRNIQTTLDELRVIIEKLRSEVKNGRD